MLHLPSSLPKPIRKLKDQDQQKSHLIGRPGGGGINKEKIAGRDPKTGQLLKTVTAELKKTENVTAEVTNFVVGLNPNEVVRRAKIDAHGKQRGK